MIRALPVNVVAGATVSKSASIMLNLRSTIFNIESTVAFESASFQTHRRHHISRRATQAVPKRKGNFRLHAVSCSIASGRVASTKSSKTSKNIQFRTTADLIVCLKHFAAISQASLSSSCEVQVQMTLAANKAVMDAHHNNGFAKGFLGLDGMKEVRSHTNTHPQCSPQECLHAGAAIACNSKIMISHVKLLLYSHNAFRQAKEPMRCSG